MTNFSHLKQLAINENTTTECELYEIEGTPSLTVSPALEENPKYFNALLKRSGKLARVVKASKVDASVIKNNRNNDRKLYSQYIIKDWKGVKNSAGEIVPFSEENCLDFLKALPNHIFDYVRDYASSYSSFVDDDIDAEEVGND